VPPPRLRRPSSFEGPIPEVVFLEWEAPLFRIQDSDVLGYRAYPSPIYRFDAPAGEYAVIYANDSEVGVFAEVYVDRGRRLGMEDARRHLVRILPGRPLRLVDLRADDTLAALDLDARISVGDDYGACQEWALAFYERWSEVSGVCYAARNAGPTTRNVALFADRCASALTPTSLGRLEDLEEIVLAATDRYGLSAPFLL
jgi:hypothetical protein